MPYIPSENCAPTDLEARAEVESLEALHALRREIVDKLAPMELLYGSGGDRAHAARRQHRDTIGKLLRTEMHLEDAPQNRIESMANSDDRHVKFCNELEEKFISYRKWQPALDEVNDKIASRLAEIRFAASEMRLQG